MIPSPKRAEAKEPVPCVAALEASPVATCVSATHSRPGFRVRGAVAPNEQRHEAARYFSSALAQPQQAISAALGVSAGPAPSRSKAVQVVEEATPVVHSMPSKAHRRSAASLTREPTARKGSQSTEGWDYRGHGDARFRYFCRINCDQADAAGFVQLGTDCTLKITLKNEVMDTIPEGVVLARRFLDERAKTYFKNCFEFLPISELRTGQETALLDKLDFGRDRPSLITVEYFVGVIRNPDSSRAEKVIDYFCHGTCRLHIRVPPPL